MFKPLYIDGVLTKYCINECGVIKNSTTGKIYAQCTDGDGYSSISLYVGERRITKKVHRLVANTFIPNPENKPEIHHKDGNRKNPKADNLMWCTRQEHFEIERERVGKFNRAKGEQNGHALFTDATVSEVVDELCKGTPFATIREKYNMTTSTLSQIYRRKSWCHLSDGKVFFKYPEQEKDVYSDDVKRTIRDHANDDITTRELIKLCGLPFNAKTKNYVKTTRRRIKKSL